MTNKAKFRAAHVMARRFLAAGYELGTGPERLRYSDLFSMCLARVRELEHTTPAERLVMAVRKAAPVPAKSDCRPATFVRGKGSEWLVRVTGDRPRLGEVVAVRCKRGHSTRFEVTSCAPTRRQGHNAWTVCTIRKPAALKR